MAQRPSECSATLSRRTRIARRRATDCFRLISAPAGAQRAQSRRRSAGAIEPLAGRPETAAASRRTAAGRINHAADAIAEHGAAEAEAEACRYRLAGATQRQAPSDDHRLQAKPLVGILGGRLTCPPRTLSPPASGNTDRSGAAWSALAAAIPRSPDRSKYSCAWDGRREGRRQH